MEYDDLTSFCRRQTDPPTTSLSRTCQAAQQKAIIEGTPDYYGIAGIFSWLETRTYKMQVRVFLSRYRSYDVCPDCSGTRFKPETLLYRLNGQNIAEVYALQR